MWTFHVGLNKVMVRKVGKMQLSRVVQCSLLDEACQENERDSFFFPKYSIQLSPSKLSPFWKMVANGKKFTRKSELVVLLKTISLVQVKWVISLPLVALVSLRDSHDQDLTIIGRVLFFDIQNNQGRRRGYQPNPKATVLHPVAFAVQVQV